MLNNVLPPEQPLSSILATRMVSGKGGGGAKVLLVYEVPTTRYLSIRSTWYHVFFNPSVLQLYFSTN